MYKYFIAFRLVSYSLFCHLFIILSVQVKFLWWSIFSHLLLLLLSNYYCQNVFVVRNKFQLCIYVETLKVSKYIFSDFLLFSCLILYWLKFSEPTYYVQIFNCRNVFYVQNMLNFGGILPIKLFDTIVLNPPIFTFTPFSAPNSKLKTKKIHFGQLLIYSTIFWGILVPKMMNLRYFSSIRVRNGKIPYILYFLTIVLFSDIFGFCISVSSETIVSSDSVTGVLVTESTPSANLLPTPALVPVYRICSIPSSGVDLPWWQQQPHVR